MDNNEKIVDLMSKAMMDTAKDIAEETPETAEEKKKRTENNLKDSDLFKSQDEVSSDED